MLNCRPISPNLPTNFGEIADQNGRNWFAKQYSTFNIQLLNKDMRHDKLERELNLLLLLAGNRGYTLEQICDRMEISRRNLYYYLEFFRDCGFIVEKRGRIYSIDRQSPFFKITGAHRLHRRRDTNHEATARGSEQTRCGGSEPDEETRPVLRFQHSCRQRPARTRCS